jgi:Tfp pilus assembly protein PilF
MPNRNMKTGLLFGVGLLIMGAGCDLHTARTDSAHLRLERTMAKTKVCVAEEFFQNGRVDQAEQILRQSLQVNPQTPEAHLLMGKIHYAYSRFDNARKSFLAALELDRDLQQAKDFLELIAQMEEQHANIDVLRTDSIALKQ